MYLCYIDESGTSDIPGNTSHFVLAGISLPIWHWRDADREIMSIKRKYNLQDSEIHTAWLLRKYLEQSQIQDFDSLNKSQRRSEVTKIRKSKILRLQRLNKRNTYRQTKKNYEHTEEYIHLTLQERRSFVEEVAKCVANWGFARLFAECIDKIHFDPNLSVSSVNEQAFEQLISRFEKYLQNTETIDSEKQNNFGLIVHDNNQTVARKHTNLMRQYHKKGTFFTDIKKIIETPLFVDSQLTSMVQIADLCSYALRRYLENDEETLFKRIYERADRAHGRAVGVRHFADNSCECEICREH